MGAWNYQHCSIIMRNYIVVFLILSTVGRIVQCIVCTPTICGSIQCVAVKDCSNKNEVIKPGGYCRCCPTCHTILEENEECSSLSTKLRGLPPPTRECGQGLVCYEGTCKSFKALSKTSL